MKPYKNREWLKEHYTIKGLTPEEIAVISNSYAPAVGRFINKFNLKHKNQHLLDNKEWLIKKYHKEKLSIHQIKRIIGCGHNQVCNAFEKHNIKSRTLTESQFVTNQRDEHKDLLTKLAKGKNNPAWKGGISIHYKEEQSGYDKNFREMIWKRDNGECQLCGTLLLPFTKLTIIHHKNGNHFDNRPENCILYCQSCHVKLHNKIRKGETDYGQGK